MLNGLRNSNEIRRYIESHFRKDIRPRIPSDLKAVCRKPRKMAADLTAALEGFDRVWQEHVEKGGSKKGLTRDMRALQQTLEDARAAIRHTRKQID